jgi:hypothetical protein
LGFRARYPTFPVPGDGSNASRSYAVILYLPQIRGKYK